MKVHFHFSAKKLYQKSRKIKKTNQSAIIGWWYLLTPVTVDFERTR
jgi:hypothetical protein